MNSVKHPVTRAPLALVVLLCMHANSEERPVCNPIAMEGRQIASTPCGVALQFSQRPGPTSAKRRNVWRNTDSTKSACRIVDDALEPPRDTDEEIAQAIHRRACDWIAKVSDWKRLNGTLPGKPGSEPWGDVVSRDANRGAIDAGYLRKLLPGCLDPPFARTAHETDAVQFQHQSKRAAQIDALASTSTDEATRILNKLRLTSRNSHVSVRNPSGRHVAMMLTSITPRLRVAAQQIQTMSDGVEAFNEAHLFVTMQIMGDFNTTEFLRAVTTAAAAIRQVSMLFVPAKTCHDLAVASTASTVDYNKNFRINMHWLWSCQAVLNWDTPYQYVVTIEDDLIFFPDFYLFHLALMVVAASHDTVNSVSPVPTNVWYTCKSMDFARHLRGDWLYSSTAASSGVADMQSLSVSPFVLPWGAGYTKRYLNVVTALYLGVDAAHLSTDRYDAFGNLWAGHRSHGHRVTLSPLSKRAGGDKRRRYAWDFGFPAFSSCNHTWYHVVNAAGGGGDAYAWAAQGFAIPDMEAYDAAA